MNIIIQSIHFDADKKLLYFIQKKIEKLAEFYEGIIRSEVYLKIERAGDEANKITEIRLIIPGNYLFAKDQCKTFEEATDRAVQSLRKQIEKHKAQQQREKMEDITVFEYTD